MKTNYLSYMMEMKHIHHSSGKFASSYKATSRQNLEYIRALDHAGTLEIAFPRVW